MYAIRVHRYVISYRSRAAKPESDGREKRGAEYRGEICISILKPVSCDERYTGLMRSPWKGKPAYARVVPTALSRLL
jgi:hypothetical protein